MERIIHLNIEIQQNQFKEYIRHEQS